MEILAQLAEMLQRGEDQEVLRITKAAVAQGLPAGQILNDGLIAGMNVVGERFKSHEIFLPDVLMSARAMYAGMNELKPLLLRDGVSSRGKVVLGTVQGDLHDIGKNLVAIMLRGSGFEVVDLGHNVEPQAFVDAAEREGARVIGLSALLTTTMPVMRRVVELVRERGLAGRVRVIVGGAPVSADFAREIGADDYGYDGASAVDKVTALMEAR